MHLTERIWQCICKIDFIVCPLEGVIEAQHVVLLSPWVRLGHLLDTVLVYVRVRRLVVREVLQAQLAELVGNVITCLDPTIIFKRHYRSALRKLSFLIFDVKHRLNIDSHTVHVQTLAFGEVDKIELNCADLALVLNLEVEPLMVATSV